MIVTPPRGQLTFHAFIIFISGLFHLLAFRRFSQCPDAGELWCGVSRRILCPGSLCALSGG